MNKWRWFWLVALVVVLVGEFWAIFDNEPGNTISENVWALLSLSWLTWIVFAAFLLWMSVHFLWPRVKKLLQKYDWFPNK